MKATFTKVYGPPWDYSRQQRRRVAEFDLHLTKLSNTARYLIAHPINWGSNFGLEHVIPLANIMKEQYAKEYKAEFNLPKPFTLHSRKWKMTLSLEDYLKLGGEIDQNTVAQLVDGLSAAETMEGGQVTSEQTRYIESLKRVVERDLAGKFQDRFEFQIYNATASQRFEAFCAARRILPPS